MQTPANVTHYASYPSANGGQTRIRIVVSKKGATEAETLTGDWLNAKQAQTGGGDRNPLLRDHWQ